MVGTRTRKPLTALQVKTLPAGMHADAGMRGLYLRVLPSGGRSWFLRYQLGGRRREMYLGSLDVLGLADARARAQAQRLLLLEKVDPIETRRNSRAASRHDEARATWTFKKAAEAVHQTLSPGWKNPKHAAQWLATLKTYVFPKVGARPVADVDVAAVLDVLKPIWTTKAETARRVRQRIDSVMRWAVAHGYATSNPVDAAAELLPKQRDAVEHHEAMPYTDIPTFIGTLKATDQTSARLALQFLILTAARSGEVRGATWREIDLAGRLWSIPAERMKAGRMHRIPLSEEAVSVLKWAVQRFGHEPEAFVFPGQRVGAPLSDMSMTKLMRDMKAGAVPHGFRSSFRDWCAENGVSRELAERALAHAVKDATEAAYHRTDQLDQRRPVMEAWGRYVTYTVRIKAASKPSAVPTAHHHTVIP